MSHAMTDADIANHNQLCAELTEHDGIPRLTWDEHCAAFATEQPAALVVGQRVVTDDSATAGIVKGAAGTRYVVAFEEHAGWSCAYPLSRLRLWPTDAN